MSRTRERPAPSESARTHTIEMYFTGGSQSAVSVCSFSLSNRPPWVAGRSVAGWT
jgi:hypothetical protein